MAATVPDGPEASRWGGVTCFKRAFCFEGRGKQAVINGYTPKLESCRCVSVSLYDAAPEEPRGLGRARESTTYGAARVVSDAFVNSFVFFFSGLLMRQGAFGSGWKLPCGGEHILPP